MVSQSWTFNSVPVLADHHFRHWKSVFEHLTGIQLSLERETFVRAVLQKRIIEKGASCFENYLHLLLSSPAFSRPEWEILFDRILIGETRFFRHRPSFDFVASYVRDRLRNQPGGQAFVKAWSLGCSTGEEAYSLAMVIYKVCRGAVAPATFRVVGTDINRTSLDRARDGVYRNIDGRGVEPAMAQAFFAPQGAGLWKVKDIICDKVSFFYNNMLEPATSSLLRDFDLISCQNVLIYLQRWRRRAVVRQLIPSLKVGGVLIVGAGDLSGWKPEGLERVAIADIQAYRRVF
ncbi:MAG: protein-glutamate O-methyltransferase CheR [Porticoccaceae bacterium]|nr:protein-glutamate O-methyltransferase CheR [Porticoccaceae bacterium]